ncbi:MAG: hypothetical protein WA728_19525 [Xanthobacteraceae bacterium]
MPNLHVGRDPLRLIANLLTALKEGSTFSSFDYAESPPGRRDRGAFMDRFIERQNIAHYVEQLKTETDPIKREMLQQLLAEGKAKQVSHAKVEE